MRRTFLITLGLIFVVGLAATAYFYIATQPDDLTVSGENNGEFGSLFPTSGDRTLPGETEPIAKESAAQSTTTTNGTVILSANIASLSASNPRIINRNGKEIVQYFEAQTGHLYEIARGESIPLKLSNTTITGIREILWGGDGKHFVIRHEDRDTGELVSLAGILSFATSSTGGSIIGEISGENFSPSVTEIASNPLGTKLFYLNEIPEGVEGIIADFDNKNPKRIFSSPLREWNIDWANESTIFLTSKAAAQTEGSSYALNTATGKLQKVLSDIEGLVTLANSTGNEIFFTKSTRRGMENFVYYAKEGFADDFPLFALPEKCAWSKINTKFIYCAVPEITPAAKYPDVWYQGLVSFDDSIWKINAVDGGARMIYDPQAQPIGTQPIDAINLTLNTSETHLYFRDKKTGRLKTIDITPDTVATQATTTEEGGN